MARKQAVSKEEVASACVSMTGFSSQRSVVQGGEILCEIRSVNSRYLDLVLRLPRELSSLEPMIREEVSQCCSRGRVEVHLSVVAAPEGHRSIRCSSAQFEAYFDAAEQLLSSRPGGKPSLWTERFQEELALKLLFSRDLFLEEAKSDDLVVPVRELVVRAVQELRSTQRTEGVVLAGDLLERSERLRALLQEVRTIHDGQRGEIFRALQERIRTHLSAGEISDERLVPEVALLVERGDISEEITRLESHLDQLPNIMKSSPGGRKIDFLLQECLREVNTIASKIQHAAGQHCAVEMKAELERMKEQTQNIE